MKESLEKIITDVKKQLDSLVSDESKDKMKSNYYAIQSKVKEADKTHYYMKYISSILNSLSTFRYKLKIRKYFYNNNLLDKFEGLTDAQINKLKEGSTNQVDDKENNSKNSVLNSNIFTNQFLFLLPLVSYFILRYFMPFSFIFCLFLSFFIPYVQNKFFRTGRADFDNLIKNISDYPLNSVDLNIIFNVYMNLFDEIEMETNNKYKFQNVEIVEDYNDLTQLKINIVSKDNSILNTQMSKDTNLNNSYFVPNYYGETMYKIFNNEAFVLLDYLLIKYINPDFKSNLSLIYKEDTDIFNYFNEFKFERDSLAQQELLESVNKEIVAEFGSNKLMSLLNKIKKNKEELGFTFSKTKLKNLEGNANFLSIVCDLDSSTLLKEVEKNKPYIEKLLDANVVIEKLSNRLFNLVLTFQLYLVEKAEGKTKGISYKSLTKYAKQKNQIYLGKSITGEYVFNMTDNAFFPIITGESGSGKSVNTMNLIVQLLNLKDSNFQDFFIISGGKTGDYSQCRFGYSSDSRGKNSEAGAIMLGTNGIDTETKILNILKAFEIIINKMFKREELFNQYSVKNIQTFNDLMVKKNKPKLGEVLVVVDELQSLLSIADSIKVDKVKAKDIIVSQIKKIHALGRASGFKMILVSQSTKVEDLGTGVRDGATLQINGRNKANVLSSLEPSGSIAKYFAEFPKYLRTEGVAFIYTSVVQPVTTQLNYANGYTLVQMPFIENDEIAKNFDKKYDTYKKYMSSILDIDSDISQLISDEYSVYNLSKNIKSIQENAVVTTTPSDYSEEVTDKTVDMTEDLLLSDLDI